MRSRQQVEDAHRLVRGSVSREARQQAEQDLSVLGLSSEPTKGLDAALREEVAKLLLTGAGPDNGLLLITHDLALARRIGGRLMIMRAGQVVETGNTEQVFGTPQSAYTRELLAADPETWSPRRSSSRGSAVVRAEGLSLERGGQALFRDVTVEIAPGGVFGVTGPSGCGKSSLGDAMLGLIRLSAGLIRRRPDLDSHAFQKLYQDPVASFPRKRRLGLTIGDTAKRAGSRSDRTVIGLLVEVVEQDHVALMLVSHDAALIGNTADAVLPLRGCQTFAVH